MTEKDRDRVRETETETVEGRDRGVKEPIIVNREREALRKRERERPLGKEREREAFRKRETGGKSKSSLDSPVVHSFSSYVIFTEGNSVSQSSQCA